MKDITKIEPIKGRVIIKDMITGEIILEKTNAIHAENMSVALARSLAKRTEGPIKSMVFGNGGATVDGLGTITYLSPNISGVNADLYNRTYTKIVNDLDVGNTDTVKNKIEIIHVNGNSFTDVLITCTLDFGEPSDQDVIDDTTDMESKYVFDELGLIDYDNKLISHLIFHPIEKAANRVIQVSYNIRILIT